jgi:methionyl-tRNA synthetase
MELKPTITIDEFSKMDIRIGTIISAEAVPDTDKLIKCTIDFGAALSGGIGIRTIVSGIKAYRTPESLIGRQVPRTIKGIESQGMLLAMSYTDTEHTDGFALMNPDMSVPAGTCIK